LLKKGMKSKKESLLKCRKALDANNGSKKMNCGSIAKTRIPKTNKAVLTFWFETILMSMEQLKPMRTRRTRDSLAITPFSNS
jgi:hypothetical protein